MKLDMCKCVWSGVWDQVGYVHISIEFSIEFLIELNNSLFLVVPG